MPGPNVGVGRRAPGAGENVEEEEEATNVGDGGEGEPLRAGDGVEEVLPGLETIHTTLVPTLKWCPKAARGDFARELATLWQRLTDNPDQVRLWVLQALFAKCILPAGRGPRAGDAYSQARLVLVRFPNCHK